MMERRIERMSRVVSYIAAVAGLSFCSLGLVAVFDRDIGGPAGGTDRRDGRNHCDHRLADIAHRVIRAGAA